MKRFHKAVVVGCLAIFVTGCTQTSAVQPKVVVKQSLPKLQLIRLHEFSDEQISSFSLGMRDSACLSLDTIRKDSLIAVMECQPTPEEKVFSEVSRVLLKYNIDANYRVVDSVIEIR